MLRTRGSSHAIAPLGVMAMMVAFVVSFTTRCWAAKPGPDTVIDSGPGTSTSSASVLFSFHGGTAASCTSPFTNSRLVV